MVCHSVEECPNHWTSVSDAQLITGASRESVSQHVVVIVQGDGIRPFSGSHQQNTLNSPP